MCGNCVSNLSRRGKLSATLHQTLMGFVLAGVSEAGQLFVSPQGSDQNLGTLEQPFHTLERAKAAATALIQGGSEDLVVNLRGGRYHLDETLVLGLEQSPKQGKLIFQAY